MEEEVNQQSTTTPSEVQATITRSWLVSYITARYQHLQAKAENTEEYNTDNFLANMICNANYTFIHSYGLKLGSRNLVNKEENQL